MKSLFSLILSITLLAACNTIDSPLATPATETPSPPATPSPAGAQLPAVYASIRIAYTNQGQLWVWEKKLSRSLALADTPAALAISSSGRKIAFLQDRQLLVIESDGLNQRVILDAGGMTELAAGDPDRLINFSWLPDDRTLLVSSRGASGLDLVHRQDLHLIDTDTGEVQTLFHAGEGGLAYPSPNGEWIAVASARRVLLIKPDGSRQSTALTFPAFQIGSFPYIPRPYWREDSQALLIEIRSPEINSIWQIPVEGTSRLVFSTDSFSGLRFSPDNSKFAYVLETSDFIDSPVELHIANLDGSDDRVFYAANKIDYGGIAIRSWSPDSSSILFTDINGNIQWMGIEDGASQIIPAGPTSTSEIALDLWIDAAHVVIARLTPDSIWLSTIGETSVEVIRGAVAEASASNLPCSFAVLLDAQIPP